MNTIVYAVLAVALVLAVAALVHQVRLRRGLQALLARLLEKLGPTNHG